MIRNQWYVVMESRQVRDRPVGVTRLGEKMVFWRDGQGQVSCLHDKCVHRGVELSKGQVLDGQLECPFHGFLYDATGRVTLIPANGRNAPVPQVFRAHSYPTYEAHGFIWVWWGDEAPADLKPPRFFDDIGEGSTYKTVYDPWDAHYSRVIENQLDVVHLPFIHRSTIGRGGRTLVDGPGLEWVDDDKFYVYVYNRAEDGTPPRRPSEVPIPDPRGFKLEFIFPNLWQNHFGGSSCIVAAFVPVDMDHTILYLRFYQQFVRLPLLRDLVAWLAMPLNLRIAHEDRRVVVTHQPQPSGLRIGEKLIQGDRPIVEYRRRREELMKAAQQPTPTTRE